MIAVWITRLLRAGAIFTALVCLIVAVSSCGHHPRSGFYSRGEISVRYVHEDGFHGRWDHANREILLSSIISRATLTHELCHACDSLGITLPEAVRMLGPTTAPGQDILALVLSQPVFGPDAHWIALGRTCGPHAIGHPEILARVRDRL